MTESTGDVCSMKVLSWGRALEMSAQMETMSISQNARRADMNVVHLCDCMDFMKGIPDKYYELAIVDPPYGIGTNHNMGRRKGDKPSDYKKVKWDDAPPSADYFDELFRVSKNQIIWGANYFTMPPCKCFIVWRKPQISEQVSFSMCEYA